MSQVIVNEVWKSINGLINYQVSNMGRIRNANTGRIWKPSLNGRGYKQVNLFRNKHQVSFSVHRLVAIEFIDNPDNKQQVDHIDQDRLNNCMNNLRWATNQENNSNRKKTTKHTSSNYKGVTFHKNSNKWRSRLMVNGKDIGVGYFANEKEASRAYNVKAKELLGEYASINEISDED